ncbi:MAG: M14 family metallopeptidase [Gemmatimonadales bacterium]
MRRLLAALVLAHPCASLAAQHPYNAAGAFDSAVPAPRRVLGHDIGERFTPHHLIARYLERLAATSGRIRVDTVGATFEGREVFVAVLSSEANRRRLPEIQAEARRLAEAGGSAADLEQISRRLPAVAWLGFTVHGGEASGTEAALALLYQLAAGRDAETRLILDSVVVLIDPLQNPDGHERHVQDVMRRRGSLAIPIDPAALVHRGSWPGPRTSHYHFDLNRDWFILSHPESRARVSTFLRWGPHVAVDLHEMGSNSTYFFAPPMEPVNKNVHDSIRKWWDIFAAANAAAFDAHGWSYFRREGYDEFYPGYGVSWPILTGAVGMTYEEASSGGGAIRREDGTVLTLHEAAHHHYTAAWATLLTTARRRHDRVRDYLEFRRSAVAEAARPPLRMIALERDASGRADSLVQLLAANGIAVQRLAAAATTPAVEYGDTQARPARLAAGTYIVDLAQPQGRLARALLEPDAQLDSSFVREELESRRTAQPSRFYDITAWSLPYTFRVRAWALAAPVAPLQAVTWITSPPSSLRQAGYAYAFEPGSEAAIRMLAALLADSVKVWLAPRSFRAGGERFPRGAFLVRVEPNAPSVHQAVSRAAAASGARIVPLASAAVDEGTDLGSNSVGFVKAPRVALLGGDPVSGNSFGFAWYAFDQRLRYPVTPIGVDALGGDVLRGFDVLVVPSAGAAALDRVLGDAGRAQLTAWVRAGGVLVTLDGATGWLATERLGLSRLRARQDTIRADSTGGAPLSGGVPGAMARVTADTLSPLLAGLGASEFAVPVSGSLIYTVPRNLRAGEAVVRFARAERVRLAGYLWPEIPARLSESPWLWTESVGSGRVIAFAGDPNFRDLWRGLLPIFANAIFIGPSL